MPTSTEFGRELHERIAHEEVRLVKPSDLANLFCNTFRPSPKARLLLHALHNKLLRQTIEHARRATRYYSQEVYRAWCETDPGEPPDLTCWPIIKRQEVMDYFDDFLANDVRHQSVCHTSGSTGPSLSIYKSSEELDFLWAYHNRLLQPTLRGLSSQALILSFPNLYHGSPVRMPSPGKVFVSGVTDDTLIHDALNILRKSYKFPGYDSRVSIISGLVLYVRFFTNFLLEQGIDPRGLGVRTLIIVGEYLSRLVRRVLSESWGALVLERFSLTESAAGANRCVKCGHFHFDPHVVVEVVDVDTGEPLKEGVGSLLLTQLYPFVQMQPLIRYDTGDLVRKVPSDCSVMTTFDFLGKKGNCIGWKVGERTQWLCFSVDLYEIVNEIADINVFDALKNVRSVKDTTVGSRQIFVQEAAFDEAANQFFIKFVFELRYSPYCYPDRIAEIGDQIIGGLRNASPALARCLDEKSVRLDLSFVGPGALEESHRVKI